MGLLRICALVLLFLPQVAAAKNYSPCGLPLGSIEPDPIPSMSCHSNMTDIEVELCLRDLQRRIRVYAGNQAGFRAQAECLCEALAEVMGSKDFSPYTAFGHECSFQAP
jgi:hypothetical protein